MSLDMQGRPKKVEGLPVAHSLGALFLFIGLVYFFVVAVAAVVRTVAGWF